MKIIQLFPGKIWGGAEQYVFDLGKALCGQGDEITYFACNSTPIRKRLQSKVALHTLPFAGACDFYSIIRLANRLKREHTDIVHIHDTRFVPIAMAAKWLSRSQAKVILTRHIARSCVTLPWFRFMFQRLHRMIFVSELAKRMWADANPWMPEEKMNVVLNSIPAYTEETVDVSLRRRHHIAEEIPLIVFTGRIRRSKGCAVLVQALGKIKQLPFVVVFIGASKSVGYSSQLLQLARRCGIQDRIVFHGFSDQTRILIQESDIGVAPSIVREACPLSPMEFMQAGKCVVATNNGAQSEYIVSGENGVLVSPDNPDELAAALKVVLQHPQYRMQLGEKAKRYFDKHLSYERFIARINKLYRCHS